MVNVKKLPCEGASMKFPFKRRDNTFSPHTKMGIRGLYASLAMILTYQKYLAQAGSGCKPEPKYLVSIVDN